MPGACVDESPPNWSVFSHVGRRLDNRVIVLRRARGPVFLPPVASVSRNHARSPEHARSRRQRPGARPGARTPHARARAAARHGREGLRGLHQGGCPGRLDGTQEVDGAPTLYRHPTHPTGPTLTTSPTTSPSLSLALLLHILSSPPHRIFRAYKPLTTFRRWARR